MDKYTNSASFLKVSQLHKTYLCWFQNNEDWKPQVEQDIIKQSNGQIRAFQTFFDSIEDCQSGKMHVQALAEKDVVAMYPRLLTASKSLPKDKFLYIFACNNGISLGQALQIDTII